MPYLPLFKQTQAVTVASSVAETTLLGTGIGTLTINANRLIAGNMIEFVFTGIHSAVSAPTIQVRVKLGTTTILDTGVVNSGNSTNAFCQIKGEITFYTIGATATVWCQGFYEETGTGANRFPMSNTAAASIDTTANQTLNITVQWGTSSASNTITITNGIFKII